MTTEALAIEQNSNVEGRKLLLIWQDPESRRLSRVAQLDALVDGRYVFKYLDGADDPAFGHLAQFPVRNQVYISNGLPAFFRNRVMSRSRSDYPQFRDWLGLAPGEDTPVEVLLRTGGPRATDTFHIVDDWAPDGEGKVCIRFFASGVRHVHGAAERINELQVGDSLELRKEESNPVNPRALFLDASEQQPVGYVPDWLVEDVHRIHSEVGTPSVAVERVNPDAPFHMMLLCRIEAELKTVNLLAGPAEQPDRRRTFGTVAAMEVPSTFDDQLPTEEQSAWE